MIQSGVAVLDKGDGHCLWTAPWLESSESLCIRHYQVDGVLVGHATALQQAVSWTILTEWTDQYPFRGQTAFPV